MRVLRGLGTPMVIDADGLWLVNQHPELVQGEKAPNKGARKAPPHCPPPHTHAHMTAGCANVVLTPNKVEFQRLAQLLGVDPDAQDALQQLCTSLGGPVVVRQGGADVVCDGALTLVCEEEGSPRRAGHRSWGNPIPCATACRACCKGGTAPSVA